jgi:hypothetical protein
MKFLVLFIEEIIQYSRTSTPTTSPNAMKPSQFYGPAIHLVLKGRKMTTKLELNNSSIHINIIPYLSQLS